jgi:hypothetical protein
LSEHIFTLSATARNAILQTGQYSENSVSVQELESAVSRLKPDELDVFARWFEEYLADQWDQRIEADIAAGRLDEAGKRADADFESGRCTPL